MIHVHYEQTPDEGDDFLDITDRINLANRNMKFTTNAEQGSVGTNSFVIDDPDGDLELTGHRRIFIQEDECDPENDLMFWGYLAERTVSRGSETPVGAARQWEVQITDINTIIGRRVMGGNDADRGEENDIDRMDWMFGTSEAVNFTDNTTFVPSTPTVEMSDSNYNGQYVQSIIDDCAQQSGRNYYVRWIYNASPSPHWEPAFWYAPDSAALAVSDLRISNVLDDLTDADTYAPSEDSTLKRDPSRVYAGVFGSYDGGWNYRTRPATTDEFVQRDTTANWPNIKKAARANARGDRYLSTLHTEEDVIDTTILVPPANVNDAHAGDMIDVRFSHFPGYEEFRSVRILSRTVTFVTPSVYQIDYTLTPIGPPPSSDSLLIAFVHIGANVSEPADLSDNAWTKVFWTGDYYSALQFPGPGGHGAWGIWVRDVVPGEGATVIQTEGVNPALNSVWVWQVQGVTMAGMTDDSGVEWTNYDNIVVSSPSAGAESVWVAGSFHQAVSYGQFIAVADSSGTRVSFTNGLNQTGICHEDNGAPPMAWLGYAQGTGVLTVGYDVSNDPGCNGATPDYNGWGRGFGGILLPVTGTFSVVQEGFNATSGADVPVTLPAPP